MQKKGGQLEYLRVERGADTKKTLVFSVLMGESPVFLIIS